MTTQTFVTFFALLTVLANLVVAGLAILWLGARFSVRLATYFTALRGHLGGSALSLAWIVALTATLGSLYYSEVANFIPCKLCWYQRIAMYPLVLILGVAAMRKDHGVRRYVLPIAATGAALSVYHYLLERFPAALEGSASCDPQAPCSLLWVWEWGYISIPFQALSAFSLIAALLLFSRGGIPPGEQVHDPETTRSEAPPLEEIELERSSTR